MSCVYRFILLEFRLADLVNLDYQYDSLGSFENGVSIEGLLRLDRSVGRSVGSCLPCLLI